MAQGSINCMHPYSKEIKAPTTKTQLDKTLIFGLSDGNFINVMFDPYKPVFLWNAGLDEQKRKSGISLIKPYDFQARGINDVIIVRDDSSVELFSLNSDQEFDIQYSSTLN